MENIATTRLEQAWLLMLYICYSFRVNQFVSPSVRSVTGWWWFVWLCNVQLLSNIANDTAAAAAAASSDRTAIIYLHTHGGREHMPHTDIYASLRINFGDPWRLCMVLFQLSCVWWRARCVLLGFNLNALLVLNICTHFQCLLQLLPSSCRLRSSAVLLTGSELNIVNIVIARPITLVMYAVM